VSDELPKSNMAVRYILRAVLAAAACALLVTSAYFLLLGALYLSQPDSGEPASNVTVYPLVALAFLELALCLRVIYLFAKARIKAGILVTALGVGAVVLLFLTA
jgi:hypothetical protein